MVSTAEPPRFPTIDLSLFDLGDPWRDHVAVQIDAASTEFGCFCLVGHGIDVGLVAPLIAAGRSFFASAAERRNRPGADSEPPASSEARAFGGGVHSLESQRLYFEAQHIAGDDLLKAATFVSGGACLPEASDLRESVLEHMRSLAGLGHKLMSMLARGLHLQDSFFVDRYTGSPVLSFQVVQHLPMSETCATQGNFAGDRADSRLLTILKQDAGSNLELKHRGGWIAAPEMPNSLVCSVGDALARLTSGRYVTATQRIINGSESHRLSMSFGFAPAPNALLKPIARRDLASQEAAPAARTDARLRTGRRQMT